MISLSNKTLCEVPEVIARPTYDRNTLTPGIVHIGLGNFHRAHQAWYLHRLMQQGQAQDWAIIGAGLRPYDADMRAMLAAQDYLTTLIELDPDGVSAEITGSMIGYVPLEDGNRPLILQMAAPEIRIVSLTVTEGGYYIDPVTQEFDAGHADIEHDAEHPEMPRTAFGAIIAALKNRRETDTGPFTLQSCDNLQGNGVILRRTVVSLARLSNPELADWIDANCSFPISMVDCIVPATGPKELELVQGMGLWDAAPVTHENFRQWVIEDDFCAGRPEWDRAGAMFSDNVHGYETQKIRILNAGHQILAGAAEVLGIRTISEAMDQEVIRDFFLKLARKEILPHVPAVSGMSAEAYLDLVTRRFANPAIVDTVRRVAFDGSSRHPGFVLPTVRDALATGAPLGGLALVEAVWARMCEGTREDGSLIKANDPHWGRLNTCAQSARTNPRCWLDMYSIYGDLADATEFSDTFVVWLNTIYNDGVEATLRRYLRGN